MTCSKCRCWKERERPQGRCDYLNTDTTAWTHCSAFKRADPSETRYTYVKEDGYFYAVAQS